MHTVVRRDIAVSGFNANKEKRQLVQSQLGDLLGFTVDLLHGIFRVPARRVVALKQLVDTIVIIVPDRFLTLSLSGSQKQLQIKQK